MPAGELLNERAGELDRGEATRLGQVFNGHEVAGRIRQDRFSPAFAGATMQKATEDLERLVHQKPKTHSMPLWAHFCRRWRRAL